MAEKRDYYEVLGVERDADGRAIKRAYRKLALKHHPDNARGDKADAERKFKECAEAYEVLSDPAKRERYDRFGHAGLRGAGVHDFSSMGFGDIFSMFEDIFGGMGGGFRRSNPSQRGLDLETEIELTLEQVATGVDQTLEFERIDLCETCGGSGSRPGAEPAPCETCGGYGQVQQQMQSFFGVSVRVTPCPRCKGKGRIVTNPCGDCDGSGRARRKRVLTIHVPPGVHDGQVVRIRGEGEPSPDGAHKGDLHVYVRVAGHPLLVRRGEHLLCEVPIGIAQAALGGAVEVPTLDGPQEVEIPAGTQTGDLVTLKQQGLPSQRAARRGDQYVQLVVEVPRKLTKRQRELLEELAETEKANVSADRKSFFEKVREYFARK